MTHKSELSGLIELLRNISLFKCIDQDKKALEELAGLFTTVTCSAGHRVIVEGAESRVGEALYIISKGTVEIIKRTRPGDPYKVAELDAEMNVFFGELALIDQEKRSATVRCKTDCEFHVLSRKTFISFGDRFPATALSITRELARIICQRLRKANNDIIVLFDALVEEVAQSGGVEQ